MTNTKSSKFKSISPRKTPVVCSTLSRMDMNTFRQKVSCKKDPKEITSLMLKVAETPAEMQKDFEELDFYQQVLSISVDC